MTGSWMAGNLCNCSGQEIRANFFMLFAFSESLITLRVMKRLSIIRFTFCVRLADHGDSLGLDV